MASRHPEPAPDNSFRPRRSAQPTRLPNSHALLALCASRCAFHICCRRGRGPKGCVSRSLTVGIGRSAVRLLPSLPLGSREKQVSDLLWRLCCKVACCASRARVCSSPVGLWSHQGLSADVPRPRSSNDALFGAGGACLVDIREIDVTACNGRFTYGKLVISG